MQKQGSRVAAVGAAALLMLGVFLIATNGTAGAQASTVQGTAFGLSADGPITVAPTPTAPPNGAAASVTRTGLTASGLNAAVTDSGSTASVASFALGTITGTVISSTCTIDASGTTLSGSSTVTSLVLPGAPAIALNPPVNTTLTLPLAAGSVVLNEQIPSGESLTVNAVHIRLLTGTPAAQDLVLAQSTCNLETSDGGTTGGTTTTTVPSDSVTATQPTTTTTTTVPKSTTTTSPATTTSTQGTTGPTGTTGRTPGTTGSTPGTTGGTIGATAGTTGATAGTTGGQLARTGSNSLALTGVASLMLAAGGLLLYANRKKPKHAA